MPALTKCPICGRENDIFAEPTGPFCSVRCKQVDLGNWFNEDYRISEPLEEGEEEVEGRDVEG